METIAKDGRAEREEIGFFVTATSFQTSAGWMIYLQTSPCKRKTFTQFQALFLLKHNFYLVIKIVLPNFQCSLQVLFLPFVEKIKVIRC